MTVKMMIKMRHECILPLSVCLFVCLFVVVVVVVVIYALWRAWAKLVLCGLVPEIQEE
jgi:hypothetical protein